MSIAPSFGWTLLSREALKKAEAQLSKDTEGVRDEIGFLSLHQAYADRFFPGTSVLHTRLRYVLFVPWIYERLMHRPGAAESRIDHLLESEELQLARRLKESGEGGVIGRNVLPKPSAQPPSMVYWSALCEWGILRRNADGSFPGRSELHRVLRSLLRRSHLHDDDKTPLEESHHFFIKVPDPPREWTISGSPLTFALTPGERKFLKRILSGVMRRGDEAYPSLLARLSEEPMCYEEIESPWDKKIHALADASDKEALIRAGQAAALSAIGRGIYAALVEEACIETDRREMEPLDADRLRETIDCHRETGLRLDVGRLAQDSPRLAADPILNILRAIQDWLRTPNSDVGNLRELFAHAEWRRKGGRARLVNTLAAQRRRAEWEPGNYSMEPLHYRWPKVRGLLQDLQEPLA